MRQKWIRMLYQLEENAIFSSIRKGLLLLIPILMTGSIALMLSSLPIPAVQSFLGRAADGSFLQILSSISDATFGFMSIFLVCSISYYYGEELHPGNQTLQIISVLVSLACFHASFGLTTETLLLSQFGAVGVFTAIICGVAGTWFYHTFYDMPLFRFHSYATGADVKFQIAMSSIVPVALSVSIFVLLNMGIQGIFHVTNLNALLSEGMMKVFEHIHTELAQGVLFVFLLHFAWFFGIHGGNIMEQVSLSLLVPANADTTRIISKSFIDNFAVMGGCGATICLVLAVLLCSKIKNNRQIAYSAIPFAIFNINEILVFGFPLILNPILFLPFLFVPMVSLLIAYGATILGWLPVVNDTVPWTTPVLLSGYVATGSWHGSIVQLVSLGIGTMLYIPFVFVSEKVQTAKEGYLIEKLTDTFRECEKKGESVSWLTRQDALGAMAKRMVLQLKTDMEQKNIGVFYQPQINREGGMKGAEALLRWQYKGKMIYPPLLVALTEEDNLYDKMTVCILEKAMEDTKTFRHVFEHIIISVNVTAYQILNREFIDTVIKFVEEKNLEGNICLEVTEGTALDDSDSSVVTEQLQRLSHCRIMTAIDDFSMGHTSLKYLEKNQFQYVKLDGSMVKQVLENTRVRDIVQSICQLGKNLQFEIVAEYVETEPLQQELMALGCHYFQGYLYSPAIPAEKFLQYCKDWKTKQTAVSME